MLRDSPLHDCHLELGAKLVEFGGWEMPLSYPSGTVAEHLACRRDAVIFDVSHLGTVRVEGRTAYEELQRGFTNDLAKIEPGRAQYTHLLDESGSVVDDCIIWWVDTERFDVMPNASNTIGVRGAIGGVDVTASRAIIAIQGPHARAKLAKVSPEAASIGRFHVGEFVYQGVPCQAAGTGYTGEDGVECAVPVEIASSFWRALVDVGLLPAGLGARDTLRLEAGLPLHSHELGPGITPLQAGLSWVVALDKPDFVGKAALVEEKAHGVRRRLRGVLSSTRRPPRAGDKVFSENDVIGEVSSGNYSPILERGIALAFLRPDVDIAATVSIESRSEQTPAVVVRPPFHRLTVDGSPQPT